MPIIKVLLLSFLIFIVIGCANEKEKCVTIVDENNKIFKTSLSIYKLSFFEYLNEIMDGHPPLSYKSGQLIAENNITKICISSNYDDWLTGGFRIESTSFLLMNHNRNYMHFGDLDSIPSRIILKQKNINTPLNIELKIK